MKRTNWLVTGGCGFIGTNLAVALHEQGANVVIIDDLSRLGSEKNAEMLSKLPGINIVRFTLADRESLIRFAKQQIEFDAVVHLAGQVSLLQSIESPIEDFESNALGTLNLLECARQYWKNCRFLYSSTNKVYGDLDYIHFDVLDDSYRAADFPRGMPTSLKLDFHGGYGCSKGAADQYVIDYQRIYGMDTIVFRQSAICGKYQHPKADQGWASYLVRETIGNRTIQLNGRGLQVRDLLDVEDLVNLILVVFEHEASHRNVYNVGGGPSRSLSLLQLFSELEKRGYSPRYHFGNERPSDQKVFVADIDPIMEDLGWEPRYSLTEIIDRLIRYEKLNNG